MSQVIFRGTTKDGIPVEVQGGWDPPLGYYHLTIFDKRPEHDEEVLYDCLTEDLGKFETNEPHKTTLSRFGIEPPDGFWERADQKLRNVRFWIQDGTWYPRLERVP